MVGFYLLHNVLFVFPAFSDPLFPRVKDTIRPTVRPKAKALMVFLRESLSFCFYLLLSCMYVTLTCSLSCCHCYYYHRYYHS